MTSLRDRFGAWRYLRQIKKPVKLPKGVTKEQMLQQIQELLDARNESNDRTEYR